MDKIKLGMDALTNSRDTQRDLINQLQEELRDAGAAALHTSQKHLREETQTAITTLQQEHQMHAGQLEALTKWLGIDINPKSKGKGKKRGPYARLCCTTCPWADPQRTF